MPTLKVDSDELVKFSKKLKGLTRSAFPITVRETLTDCARDMKMNTIIPSAKKAFLSRTSNDNFFRANSGYEKATGFNVSAMKATVGMSSDKLKDGSNNFSVKELEQQEQGGSIPKKSLIPMIPARSGNKLSGLVRPNARLKAIRNAINVKNIRARNNGQKFLLAATKAGNGGYVIAYNKGNEILWRINSVASSLNTRGLVVKATPLYDVKKNRSVHVKATHFIQRAGEETYNKIDELFIARAQKTMAKYWTK